MHCTSTPTGLGCYLDKQAAFLQRGKENVPCASINELIKLEKFQCKTLKCLDKWNTMGIAKQQTLLYHSACRPRYSDWFWKGELNQSMSRQWENIQIEKKNKLLPSLLPITLMHGSLQRNRELTYFRAKLRGSLLLRSQLLKGNQQST